MNGISIQLRELLDAAKKSNGDGIRRLPPDIVATRLKDHYADLKRTYPFRVGDLVRHKPAMNIRRSMDDSTPAIITRIFREMQCQGLGCGHPHNGTFFNCTLLVLMQSDDGECAAVEILEHLSRFEPYPGTNAVNEALQTAPSTEAADALQAQAASA